MGSIDGVWNCAVEQGRYQTVPHDFQPKPAKARESLSPRTPSLTPSLQRRNSYTTLALDVDPERRPHFKAVALAMHKYAKSGSPPLLPRRFSSGLKTAIGDFLGPILLPVHR
jgi:hypothetical protein